MARFLAISIPLLLCGFISHAQVTSLYFFEQEIIGGAPQQAVQKTGTGLPGTGNTSRFFLFAETKKGTKPVINQLWINGKLFSFKPAAIKELPFILRTSAGGEMVFTDTLVKKTAASIVQLTNVSLQPKQPGRALIPKTALQNAVVIYYTAGKKKMYFKTNTVQQLRPLFAQ